MASTLKLLQFNVWCGSTFEFNWRTQEFGSYETAEMTEKRYQAMLQSLKHHDPDVITLNECMPLWQYCKRLAGDLPDYDFYCRTGLACIVLGPLYIPSSRVTRGDCILAKRELGLRALGRCALTGRVFSEYLAFNFGSASQAIAASIVKHGRTFVIGCTHWTAGVVDERETRSAIERMKSASAEHLGADAPDAPLLGSPSERTFTLAQLDEGEMALQAGTAMKMQEAMKTINFMKVAHNKTCELPPNTVYVLAGDFNTVADTPEFRYITETSGYRHVALPPGSATWDTKNPNVVLQERPEGGPPRGPVEERLYTDFAQRCCTLDYVFVKGDALEYEASICMKDEVRDVTTVCSDHYGVLVTLKF